MAIFNLLLNLLLSSQAIIGIVGIISLGIVVRAVTAFASEVTELRVRLTHLDREMHRLRSDLPEKRQSVEAVRNTVRSLKLEYGKIQVYLRKLQDIQNKAVQGDISDAAPEARAHGEIRIRQQGSPNL